MANAFQSKLLGAAGEHLVMSRLLLMGVTACLAPEDAKGVDIVVTDSSGESFASIQVKTKIGRPGQAWRLTPKAESLANASLFYVFVGFDVTQIGEVSELLVVPSDVVANLVRLGHMHWLNTPGKNGQRHNDSTVRLFHPNPKPVVLEGVHYGPNWTKTYENNWSPILSAVKAG